MDVAIIDYYANSGKSFLHRASALCKIIFAALIIASIVITNDLILLFSIYVMILALVIWTRLPFLKIVSIAAYPAIFALLFVFASWNGNWIRAGVILLKAMTAALCMVLLIVTTPYPDVFSTIRPLLPKIVAEGMFLTYRSIFILLKLTDNLISGLKVRGGISRGKYIKNISNFASGIGLLLVRGFDMSEKFYGAMLVRGYDGRMVEERIETKFNMENLTVVLMGVIVFFLSLGISFWSNFNYFGIYILATAATTFFVSVFCSYFYRI